jgi:hypothetical protein
MKITGWRKTETRDAFVKRLFWTKVDRREMNECWNWTGTINRSGYGKYQTYGQHRFVVSAHRFSYLLEHGEIPKSLGHHGTVIAHSCDNRRCVNPAHLFACTQGENLRDCIAKGRGNKAFGEDAGRAKLSETAAKLALSLAREGLDRNRIAARLSVTPQTISDVVSGKSWVHLDRDGVFLVEAIRDTSNMKANSGSFKKGCKGNPGQKPEKRTIDYALAASLCADGYGIREIARRMNTTHTTVRRALSQERRPSL